MDSQDALVLIGEDEPDGGGRRQRRHCVRVPAAADRDTGAGGSRNGRPEGQRYAAAIRQVGPEYCILSSDLGQAGNPLHPDGLEAFFAALRGQGFSGQEIERMSKVNPARLLGL